MRKTKKLTIVALLAAVAMVLSYLESLLPSVAIPGVKLGLANVAVMFALYRLGLWQACLISLIRVATVSMLFGNFAAFAYSVAGAVLSLLAMELMRRTGLFSSVGVSVMGGVAHNIGQILMAVVLLGTNKVIWYLPVLIITGTISGVLIGLAGATLLKRTDIKR